jgi:hypothetical protein
MLFRVGRDQAYRDLDGLAFWLYAVENAAKTFAELSERFREAIRRSRNPRVLKRDVHGVLPIQAGRLLCECCDNGAFPRYTYYRGVPPWDLRYPDATDHVYVWVWFAFIRWALILSHEERFRPDWKEQFHPALDQLIRDYSRGRSC